MGQAGADPSTPGAARLGVVPGQRTAHLQAAVTNDDRLQQVLRPVPDDMTRIVITTTDPPETVTDGPISGVRYGRSAGLALLVPPVWGRQPGKTA